MKPAAIALAVLVLLASNGAASLLAGANALLTELVANGGNTYATDTLNPPTALTATNGASISLSWTATSDTYATGHRIYRATVSGGPYSQIAQVTPRTTTTYVDTPPAGTYYYIARAYHQNWESVNSNQASAATSSPRYYLHNNPTPPTAGTNSQANLPLTTIAPTATTLYNYDQDRDAFAGRVILKGGSGAIESDLTKYQNWRTAPLSSDQAISGNVSFTFWSGVKDFGQTKRGVVVAYLRHFDGSAYTTIGTQTLDVANWQGGSATWVSKTVTFSGVSYTIPAGHHLEVKIVVGGLAADDMWFAYDTVGLASRLDLP